MSYRHPQCLDPEETWLLNRESPKPVDLPQAAADSRLSLTNVVEAEVQNNKRDSATGKVDPPVPAPGNVLGKRTSSKRANATGKSPYDASQAKIKSSFSTI